MGMWSQKENENCNGNGNPNGNDKRRDKTVAVAIDNDKTSQFALKWAVDHLLSKGQTVTLIHVKQTPSSIPTPMGGYVALSDGNDGVTKAYKTEVDNQAKGLFLPFRAFCTRKDIKCNEVIIEGMDIAKVICDYVKINLIETLVVGAASRNSFVKRIFKASDVPTSLSKGAPEFCRVYVISKGKISSERSASIPVPNRPPRSVQYHSYPSPSPAPGHQQTQLTGVDVEAPTSDAPPGPPPAARYAPLGPSFAHTLGDSGAPWIFTRDSYDALVGWLQQLEDRQAVHEEYFQGIMATLAIHAPIPPPP